MADGPAGHGAFAMWNRSGNRLVAALLRSGLHPLVSGHLALISVTGRRTGAEHTFPVGYRLEDGRVTIPVMWPQRKLWWRNLKDEAPVRLQLAGDRTRRAGARAGRGCRTRDRGGAARPPAEHRAQAGDRD